MVRENFFREKQVLVCSQVRILDLVLPQFLTDCLKTDENLHLDFRKFVRAVNLFLVQSFIDTKDSRL